MYALCVAIEVRSPTGRVLGSRKRAAYYLAHGVRLVWLFCPEQRLIEVYAPGAGILLLTIQDTLTGGDVLPGFAVAVAETFPA